MSRFQPFGGAVTVDGGEAIIDLRDGADERVEAWIGIAIELARLDRPLPYVGSFGAVLRAAASHAESLPARHQRIAADVIVRTTAAKARRLGEFRDGIEAAATLDPAVLDSRSVIGRVLRPTLESVDERHRLCVSFASTVVLETIGTPDLQLAPAADVTSVLEAAKVVPALADALRAHARQQGRRERKLLLALLDGERVSAPRQRTEARVV